MQKTISDSMTMPMMLPCSSSSSSAAALRAGNAPKQRWLVGTLITIMLIAALAGCRTERASNDFGSLLGSGSSTAAQASLLADAAQARDAGELEVALGLFRDVLAENPTIVPAYLGIGDIYMVQRDFAQAEPVFARAARLEPRNFDAQFGHGRSLQMLGQFLRAVQAYHRALSIDPNHPDANHNIASSYMQMNEMRSALIFAEKAIELDPRNGAARVNLGAIYEEVGEKEAAIEQYLMALELLPINDTPPVMLNLINVLASELRYQEAANTAENLARITPSANAYERLGWARFRLRDYEGSMEAYEAAIELDPNHWPSLNGVGVNALNTWLQSGRTDAEARRTARDAFRRSLRINRNQQKLITLMSNYNLS